MRILFTCSGRRGYLFPFFRSVAEGVEVLAADSDAHASSLLQADRGFLVPPSDSPQYGAALATLCRREEVDLLFSLHDYDLLHVAEAREALRAAGTTVVVSETRVLDTCLDKMATAKFLAEHSLPSLPSWTAEEACIMADRGELSFPVIVKPVRGSASIDLHRVDRAEDLYAVLARRNDFFVQWFADGQEYGLDILNDLEGNLLAVTVKHKLNMRNGETDKSVTVKDSALIELGARLGRALGHVGNLDADVFVTAAGPAVNELNPRFGGGYPGSHVAGADYPRKLLTAIAGEYKGGAIDDYEEGVYCLKGISIHSARLPQLTRYQRVNSKAQTREETSA
jgi:carbamoyl-phosphate synthase large subunit